MFYCENCGTELRPSVRFCEECGTQVPSYALATTVYDTLHDTIFSHKDWKQTWQKVASEATKNDCRIGILLTNTDKCNPDSQLFKSVKEFIAFKNRQQIRYFCLDMATETVFSSCGNATFENVLKVLRAVYSVHMPEYLMILGDISVIGAVKWDCAVDHHDKYLYSDLPYLTMDLSSPWDGMRYNFDHMVLPGRIPGNPEDDFDSVCTYLENYMSIDQTADRVNAFGLSALQWQEVSQDIYRDLGSQLLLSPQIVLDSFTENGLTALNHGIEPNLLYFNLHGSDIENYWYGQHENWMPRAFAAAYLPRRKGYVIGVEACYGAIQVDSKQPPSILLEAMKGGCLAFLGSNTVAFGGQRRGENSCADIIVHHFLKCVKQGYDFGHAYLNAFKELYCTKYMNDAIIKTCAQFALYGDPSATLLQTSKSVHFQAMAANRTISVAVPDVRTAVRMALCEVSAEIKAQLVLYIAQHFSEFKGVVPENYHMQGTSTYQSMYTRSANGSLHTLKLYYDKTGTILHAYVSH